ncbi:hypothetical protein B0T22DRAFT_452952 [Podospora appendiculata]|uniref:Uncharacterized protein n=1 Tax=Podospora appendiculata TaxID=314037 RepID=A0AAE1CHA4_9PEZI|nr:hypothetical protein B0T22DRAFT_452952 [Podospora appendiculata]
MSWIPMTAIWTQRRLVRSSRDSAHCVPNPRTPNATPEPRHGFEIAIMPALPLKATAVAALFDKEWDAIRNGKATEDKNTYSVGVVGRHHVTCLA